MAEALVSAALEFESGPDLSSGVGTAGVTPQTPFGTEFPKLDSLATGEWWNAPTPKGPNPPPSMDVPRDQVVAFALYTHERGVLKADRQLYPLKPDEDSEVRLELERQGEWVEVARVPVTLPGWSAHFRMSSGTRRSRCRTVSGMAKQLCSKG